MKKIHIEFSDERLITSSGLVFVGQILWKKQFCYEKIKPCAKSIGSNVFWNILVK